MCRTAFSPGCRLAVRHLPSQHLSTRRLKFQNPAAKMAPSTESLWDVGSGRHAWRVTFGVMVRRRQQQRAWFPLACLLLATGASASRSEPYAIERFLQERWAWMLEQYPVCAPPERAEPRGCSPGLLRGVPCCFLVLVKGDAVSWTLGRALASLCC